MMFNPKLVKSLERLLSFEEDGVKEGIEWAGDWEKGSAKF
jgi:hypothetical protein